MRRFWHWLIHDYILDVIGRNINAHAAAQKQSMDYYMKELVTLRVELQAIQDAFRSKQTFAVEEAEAIRVLGEDYFA